MTDNIAESKTAVAIDIYCYDLNFFQLQFSVVNLQRKLIELAIAILKALMLACVFLRVGGTGEPGGKPPTLDGRLPLFCHMPIPGFKPGRQR